MAEVSPGRAAALEALRMSGRGMRLDLAMNRTGAGLESRERGFAQELAYGAIRLQGRLDHLLAGLAIGDGPGIVGSLLRGCGTRSRRCPSR